MNKKILFLLLVFGCQDPEAQSGSNSLDIGANGGSADSTQSDNGSLDSSVELDQEPHSERDADITQMDLSITLEDLGRPQDGQPSNTAGIIWMGPTLIFEKPASAETTSPEAQDRITEDVVLTRGDGNVLFNIAVEASANGAVSPRGTLWAMGTTDELEDLTFSPLREAANNRMQELPGKDMVLFLPEENIYIDVRFLSWRSGRGRGGAFSYERRTPD